MKTHIFKSLQQLIDFFKSLMEKKYHGGHYNVSQTKLFCKSTLACTFNLYPVR